jgi:hypothetical protein
MSSMTNVPLNGMWRPALGNTNYQSAPVGIEAFAPEWHLK